MPRGTGPCFIACGIFAAIVRADAPSPAPAALEPGEWLGVDGNWSTVKFSVGSPAQEVNVLVSTSLSEFWTIGSGGCQESDRQCLIRRGGVYTSDDSSSWFPLDYWELGLHWLGLGGNGEYGLDLVETRSSITGHAFSMAKTLLATVNTTDYFNGLFGLGITQSSFGNRVAESALTQAVKTYGYIPSYSYGFTAGAHYKNTPASVTLGGHDVSRYVDHSSNFTLTRSDGMPRPLVRGIEVYARNEDAVPDHWTSRNSIVSDFNGSFVALIDSTTPYLWLPDAVCDRFAEALSLTYNSTLDLYTITDDVYDEFMRADAFSFTFSLSSPDISNDLGSPLDVPGVVNITLSTRALLGLVQYPYMDGALNYGDPAVPYFSLRRTPENSTFIIGRAFLQESYLITRYDEQLYSIHQALFPDDPVADAQLESILQPPDSGLPAPAKRKLENDELTDAQKAGISVGVILGLISTVSLLWYFLYYRRRIVRSKVGIISPTGHGKDFESSVTPTTPISGISRMLSMGSQEDKNSHSTRVGTAAVEEAIQTPLETSHSVSSQGPHEAPNSEIHELPALEAPKELDAEIVPPIELEASDTSGSYDTMDDFDAANVKSMTAYEISRRFIEKQLQGPLPAYSPPTDGSFPLPEKSNPFAAPREQQPESRPGEGPRALLGANSLTQEHTSWMSPSPGNSLRSPSPVSPWGDFSGVELSTLTGPDSVYNPTTEFTPSNSYASTSRAPEPAGFVLMPPPAARRSTIDANNIICLGPLTENVQLSRSSPVDQYSTNTYGSGQYRARASQLNDPGSPIGMERIDSGEDIVHVPQLAAKRYSWEDPR
ncbi:hypothetical protein S40293_06190 [Stachybotrys chartarum IBT 40293]|nr:hypothetical protein S40293_06190 [Stachybotrys chartarum IBT 40293]